jgi:AcrR family transcriptional regulator
MDSDNSTNRRIPQQQRGERRVAELLEAAASEFAEVGYEAATMTAIAKRASASIGAIYQYFPNKAAVVSALRTQYVNEMEERWMKLEEATAGLSVRQRTQSFVDAMIRFMVEHPSYITILDATTDSKRDKETRDRLRARLANVLRTRRPAVSREQAYRVACVSLQMIKSMNALYAEAKPQERLEIVKEYKLALTVYLEKRLLYRAEQ